MRSVTGRTIVYLDYAASAPAREESLAAERAYEQSPIAGANPNALHTPGREAARALDGARRDIARCVGGGFRPSDVVFTSGGTESNNLALLGLSRGYVKLISQLFGDRQIVANATGCSSIYSASVPSSPYTVNAKGHGPAWANSLFEDFCEFGLGMTIADEKMRNRVAGFVKEAIDDATVAADVKALYKEWLENFNDGDKSRELSDKILEAIEHSDNPADIKIRELGQYLVKRSQWIIGGDGASYDIGFGGLDHVIASGKNVNILVLDTEVYSNTGGQASKATPIGAIAKFAAAGKRVRKKDLGLIASTYGYVYAAQIAMGANDAQCLKAIREAEAYDGPSIIIAYAPCINHGIKKGMGKAQAEEKAAVACGYWHLWRYNPQLEAQGQNPFTLDSPEPNWDNFEEFLKGEVRYASVLKQYPDEAAELFAAAKENAQWRYNNYRRLARQQWGVDPEA